MTVDEDLHDNEAQRATPVGDLRDLLQSVELNTMDTSEPDPRKSPIDRLPKRSTDGDSAVTALRVPMGTPSLGSQDPCNRTPPQTMDELLQEGEMLEARGNELLHGDKRNYDVGVRHYDEYRLNLLVN